MKCRPDLTWIGEIQSCNHLHIFTKTKYPDDYPTIYNADNENTDNGDAPP